MNGTLRSAVEKAHSAYEAARGRSIWQRAGWLVALADALETHAEELVPLAHEETHLPLARLQNELMRTAFQLRLLATEIERGKHLDVTIDHADSDWGMGPRPDLRRMNIPLGVVAVFGASNFPFAFSVLGGDTASALAAGCAVVHKAHPDHPRLARRTAELTVETLADAGAPDGLFALVEDQHAGGSLIEEPLVRAVGFTGSTGVGRALFDRAASRPDPIPFFGELGSTNPVFVTEAAWEARGEEILRGFAASSTLGMGQFCTKPGFLVLPSSAAVSDDLLRKAAAPSFDLLSPRLTQGFRAAASGVLERTGVTPLGAAPTDPGINPMFLTVSAADALAQPDLLQMEIFGPASVVIRDADANDREQLAESLTGQLTCSIWAEPDDDIGDLVRILELKAGRILFDDWPTGVTVSYAQNHGGPYPASTAAAATSVGTAALRRFLRPVAYQGFPDGLLPPELREANPLALRRRQNGKWV